MMLIHGYVILFGGAVNAAKKKCNWNVRKKTVIWMLMQRLNWRLRLFDPKHVSTIISTFRY